MLGLVRPVKGVLDDTMAVPAASVVANPDIVACIEGLEGHRLVLVPAFEQEGVEVLEHARHHEEWGSLTLRCLSIVVIVVKLFVKVNDSIHVDLLALAIVRLVNLESISLVEDKPLLNWCLLRIVQVARRLLVRPHGRVKLVQKLVEGLVFI